MSLRGLTAMSRSRLSRPVRLAIEDGVLQPEHSVFDYGCGRGGDLARLGEAGYKVSGWDPSHAPDNERRPAEVVNLGYVVNVIESPQERVDVLRDAWSLAGRALIVAARPDFESGQLRGREHGDGLITSKGTFQKFYAQDELRSWIAGLLGTEPVAAAPGIFYVFRDPTEAAGLRARRFRTRSISTPRPRRADALWDEHRELLEPLALFWEQRGRLPEPMELDEAPQIQQHIGSVRSAAGVLRRVLGDERFQEATRQAERSLLVFLALEAFRGRPRFSELPSDVALDVRALFGSYKAACAEADALLFSMADEHVLDEALRTVPFGKVLPDAVYVHTDYLTELPPLVRVFEGAGRALLGEVAETTLIKLSRRERRISYLSYPTFEKDPHPHLATSLRVDLRSFRVRQRDYRASENPPILHRKETFVPQEHPSREKFERLTIQEERAGLFEDSNRIGNNEGWQEALAQSGLRLHGHRLVRGHNGPQRSADQLPGEG